MNSDDLIADPQYWIDKASRPNELEPRSKCCGSCPAQDMYIGFVEGLKLQPDHIRIAASKRWFCHTTPSKACFGNWQAQGFANDITE